MLIKAQKYRIKIGHEAWFKLNKQVVKIVISEKRALVFANDIRKAILTLANMRGPGNLFYPAEVAKRVDSENWVTLIDQVHLVADSLISEGKIVVSKSGKAFETAYTKKT
jgi:hypothetical protein